MGRSGRAARMVLGVALATLFLMPAANAGADSLGDPFRLSPSAADSGPAGDAYDPSLAYDAKRDRYLSVWCATTPVADKPSDLRIWARFIGGDGVPQGDAVAISDALSTTSSDCDNGFTIASDPWAVYNAAADEFMVTWHGGSNPQEVGAVAPSCSPDVEIYGQRLSGAGLEVGSNDFQISHASGCSVDPIVAYDAIANDYLVVWGEEPPSDPAKVLGQRLDSAGALLGDQLELSSSSHNAAEPYVVDIAGSKRFFVAWEDTDADSSSAVNQEIRGQLVDAETGAEVGTDDFLIAGKRAMEPSLAYNSRTDEVLALWTAGPEANESGFTVRGQRLKAAGDRVGDSFDVSSPIFDAGAKAARVAYDSRANEYQAVYQAQAAQKVSAVAFGTRIYGQRLAPDGTHLGTEAFPVSSENGDEEARTIAYNPARCEYLTLWESIPSETGEIFGRRLAGGSCPAPAAPRPPAPAGGVLGVQSRKCASRRFFRIRIVERRSDRITKAVVTVGGRRAKVSYGKRTTARIDLRTMPKGAFTVRIRVRLQSGRRLSGTRRYHTCTEARNPNKRLKL